MMLDDLRSQKREAIMAIAARHGVTEIRVFGSQGMRGSW
jgi:predicted nucleotidyltransferase